MTHSIFYFFSYLCQVITPFDSTEPMFHKQLIWACDFIILNACCLTIMQVWFVGADLLWGLSLLNCVAVIALRQWLMKTLQIPWLVSLLNQGLKRLTDIVVSTLFLMTLFPAIITVLAILIKSSNNHRKALFSEVEVYVNAEKHFTAWIFSNYPQQESKNLIYMTPLALQLLTGTISLSDVPSLSITSVGHNITNEASESGQESQPDSIACGESNSLTPNY